MSLKDGISLTFDTRFIELFAFCISQTALGLNIRQEPSHLPGKWDAFHSSAQLRICTHTYPINYGVPFMVSSPWREGIKKLPPTLKTYEQRIWGEVDRKIFIK